MNFRTGFTIAFSKPMTIATITADPYPFTDTPGKIFAKPKTTNAETKRLIIKPIIIIF